MKRAFILMVAMSLLFLVQLTYSQGFSKAEYFFDADPGVNNGTAITLSGTSDTVNFSAAISTASLTPGFHYLGLRVLNNDGKWGIYEHRGIYISSTTADAANITSAEYFFDTDPGVGNGITTPVGTSGAVVNFTAIIPTSLSTGFHFLAIRTRDANGIWGLLENRGFYVSNSSSNSGDITSAEYFLDHDPGVGNGTATSIGSSGPTVNFTAVIPNSLPDGFHYLAIRTKGADGVWGLYDHRGFYISTATADAPDITAAEYFLDTDPGAGNGIAAPIGVSGPTVNFTAAIPSSLPVGFHFLAIRTKGANGVWSLFEKRGFFVSQATGDMPTLANVEYFFDADPGVGNATPLTLNTPGNTINQTFSILVPISFAQGQHFLAIRTKDLAGNWSLYEYVTFNVTGVVPVTGLSLSATKSGNSVQLNWYTFTETNTSHFEIERSSNGINFEKIGETKAVGNSSQRIDYSFNDAKPEKNLSYYRLKQVDLDGHFTYSEIKTVRFTNENQYKVFPSITQGSLHIDGVTEPVIIKFFNGNGQLVRSIALNNTSPNTLDITNLQNGMYWLLIEKKGELLYTQKIVKQ